MTTVQNKIQIFPTVVPNSLADVLTIQEAYEGMGVRLHIDISDGVFAKGGKWNMPSELPQEFLDNQKFEVHLMVADPEAEAERWLPCKPERVIFHHEACDHAVSLAEKILVHNSTPVVALNFETPISILEDIYPDVTNFQLMAIEKLGKQGAPFNTDIFKKISSCKESFPDAILSIDGGVNLSNAHDLVLCGASQLCVGSALSKSADSSAEYKKFLAL
ncbi:MAG: hypothetical protein WC764_00515 [Candidatus Paceibacterota bacterium]|jgi:ribulose-phosphate 3-epimerase